MTQVVFVALPSCVGGTRRSTHGWRASFDADERLLAGADLMGGLGRHGVVGKLM